MDGKDADEMAQSTRDQEEAKDKCEDTPSEAPEATEEVKGVTKAEATTEESKQAKDATAEP